MEKNEERKTQPKKQFKLGVVTQKMMSFRLDIDNIEYLNTKANKGRFINELLTREREKEQK